LISPASRLRLAAVAALLASSLLHVAAMAISPEFGQEILVEGGDNEQEAVLGSDFADLIKAGDRLEPVQTQETEATTTPKLTRPVATPAKATAPVISAQSAVSPSSFRLDPSQDESLISPSASERVESSTPQAPANQQEQETPRTIKPTSVETSTVPVKPAETVAPVERTEPVVANAPADVPKPVAKPKRQKKPRQKASAGSKTSSSKVNAKAGSQDGKAKARASSSGKSKSKPRSANSGNAAAANYPGKVYAKIARTRQRNAGGRGVTHVSFHVTASGQAVRVAVSKSSGSTRVDKAALAHIKRAAPFPKPPAGARTRFVIPIEFRR